VDLANVKKHQLDVGVGHHMLTPCIEILNCLVEVDSNQLQTTHIAGGLQRGIDEREGEGKREGGRKGGRK